MRSVKYLEKVKEKYGLTTDAALAMKLGIGKSAVSHYMKGLRVMDSETCAAIALALELNEHEAMQLVMAAGVDRAEQAGQKSLWSVFSERMATVAASAIMAVTVTGILTPQNAEARTYAPSSAPQADPIYIMSNEVC